ncbi:MAG: MFS transporter [Pseudomonadota bacterium]
MVLTGAPTPSPWRDPAILCLMIAELLVWSGFFYAFIAMPLNIAASTGWSLSQVMGAYSVSVVCMALATPLAGRLIDKGWAPVSLPLGAVFGATALALVATAPSLPVFYVLWACVGVAMGLTLYEPVFGLILRARGEAARGAITAISIAAGSASLVTFPSVYLLTQSFGWPVALWVFSCLILLVAAPSFRFASNRLNAEGTARPNHAETTSRRVYFQDRRFRALMLIFVLPALTSGMLLSHILPVLDAARVPAALATAAAAFIGPMQIAARLLVQAVATNRSAQEVVLGALLCLTASAIALFYAGQTIAALIVFVLCFGIGNGLVGVFRPLVVRDRLGASDIGAKTGAIAMPALLAVAAGPILGARVLETADIGAFMVIAAACPLLAFMALAALPKHEARE